MKCIPLKIYLFPFLLTTAFPSHAWTQSKEEIFNGDWNLSMEGEKEASNSAYFFNDKRDLRMFKISASKTEGNLYRLYFLDYTSKESCKLDSESTIREAWVNGLGVNLYAYCDLDGPFNTVLVSTPLDKIDYAIVLDGLSSESDSIRISYGDIFAKISTKGFSTLWGELLGESFSAKYWSYNEQTNTAWVASSSYKASASVWASSSGLTISFDIPIEACISRDNVQAGQVISINGRPLKTYELCSSLKSGSFKTIWAQSDAGNRYILDEFIKSNNVSFHGYNKSFAFSAKRFNSQHRRVRMPL